jgi:hypothetical protein
MKKYLRGAALFGAFLAVTGCASGVVIDKRAPGYPGEKTLQIQVDVDNPPPFGPDEIWVTVDGRVWDACKLYDVWPDCEVDGSS